MIIKRYKFCRSFILCCVICLLHTSSILSGALIVDIRSDAARCHALFEALNRLAENQNRRLAFRANQTGVVASEQNPIQMALARGRVISRELFRETGISESMMPHFDTDTGRFQYQPKEFFRLAVENGDSELKAIRINLTSASPNLATQYLKELQPLLNRRPKLEIWVLGNPKDKALQIVIANMPLQMRKRIKIVVDFPAHPWAQDGSKTLENGDVLLPRGMDSRRRLASYQEPVLTLEFEEFTQVHKTPFRFEGGNLIVGARNIFVGPEIVEYAKHDFKITRDEALAALSAEFGKPVIELGHQQAEVNQVAQVDFHLDLSMAVVRDRKTGIEKVLVGSVAKAAELLTARHQGAGLGPASFLDLAKASTGPSQLGERNLAKLLEKVSPQFLEAREQKLNQIASELEAKGYQVERIPDIALPHREDSSEYPEMVSYANSLFSGNVALLPEMGVPVWDNYMKSLMGAMGYEPIMLSVAQKSMCLHGGPRCMSETYRHPPR